MQAVHKYGNTQSVKMFAAAGALSAGDVVVNGNRVGVVSGSKPIAVGDDYTLLTNGVFEMTALGTDTYDDGQTVYWDDTNNRTTETASTHKVCGVAVGAKGSGPVVSLVDLNVVTDTDT